MEIETRKPSIKLMQYSRGGGCGCKISPKLLDQILDFELIPKQPIPYKPIYSSWRNDAAVYDLKDGNGLICSTDFFMPIVDDPFDFGRISAANALSDIYAMGGRPLSALSILIWPTKVIAAEVAKDVLKGAKDACQEAGIVIAGGHSISGRDPIFGMSVNGIIPLSNVKCNFTAKSNDCIFITKSLGVGVMSTACKKGILSDDDLQILIKVLSQINNVGMELGTLPYVTAMTDVTGFGLLGHLLEMCHGNSLSAHIQFDRIPILKNVDFYFREGCKTGGGARNLDSYGSNVWGGTEMQRDILSDPQTNGGLLIAIDPKEEKEFIKFFQDRSLDSTVKKIGVFRQAEDVNIKVVID